MRIAAGRDMAGHITGAQFVDRHRNDHCFFASDRQPVLAAIEGDGRSLCFTGTAGRVRGEVETCHLFKSDGGLHFALIRLRAHRA